MIMKNCIVFWLLFLFVHGVTAKELPLDGGVITGKLPNGLTYYILKNRVPEGRACFYLVQNVGALLENEQQNGLAHFLEHMAFNGSLHFPDKSMIRMLERHGIVYGKNINAYTSLNETIYGLNDIPADDGMVDSCLMVLRDWSHFLTLDSGAIQAERSVILEEWRSRRDAGFRLDALVTPVVLKGSQYAVRDIIGDTAVIRNIGADEFRSFYHTWYRPGLQAIVVVGDVDAVQVEQKIKVLFSGIPASEGLPVRPFFEIPTGKDPVFIQAEDPEAKQERIEIRIIQRAGGMENKDSLDLRMTLATELFNRLMKERLYETFSKDRVPATGAGITRHLFRQGYDALTLVVLPRPGYEEEALEATWTIKERVKKFGFTKTEMDYAKTMMLREAEATYGTGAKIPSVQYVERLSRHFLGQEQMPDPLSYLAFVRRELPLVASEELIACLRKWDSDGQRHMVVTGPTGMKRLSGEWMQQIFQRVEAMDLQPLRDTAEVYSLFSEQPAGGKIVKSTRLENFGAEEWILSNGVRVIFRTDDRQNGVSLLAYHKGGTSQSPLEDLPTACLLSSLANNYGAGNLDVMQLDKLLSVRNVSCGVALKPWYVGIGGKSPSAEVETLLQMVWLRLERPRFDASVHGGLINRFKSQLDNRKRDPFQCISDTLTVLLANNDPRRLPVTKEQLGKITIERVEKVYREQFADPAGFTFLIVGKTDVEKLKSLAGKYLGSLPSGKRIVRPVMPADRPVAKYVSKEITLPLAVPNSTVILNFSGKMKYTLKNELYNRLLKDLVELRSMQQLREKAGATYQVVVQESFEINPVGKCSVMVHFDCAPGREKELAAQVYTILHDLAEQGPTEDELNKMVRKIQSERELSYQEDGFWTDILFSWYFNGVDKTDPQNHKQWLEQMTIQDVRKFARDFLKVANRAELIVKPEK